MTQLVIDARESGSSTGRYIDKLIGELSKLKPGFEVAVLTKTKRMDYLQHLAPNLKILKSNWKEFTFGEQLGLWRQIKSLDAELVHFGMIQQPILYRGLVVTTIHDLTTMRFDNPAKDRLIFKFKQQVYKFVIKRVARKSRYIITPSEYVKHDVAQYAKINPGKIFVTYEAADKITALAKEMPRLAGKQFIMYVGRPTPHKNLDRLIGAFELLRRKYPDLILVLAGKTDRNYRRLEKLVSEKRLADSVVFTDFISEGELRWLYEHTAAYVFPSLSEGFGLPGLEAMAHGAPVVSSSATCLPEIYGEAAHYFNPLSTTDMATKINDVLSKPHLKATLAHRGRAQAAKYSWQRMARQTLKIYEQALKTSS